MTVAPDEIWRQMVLVAFGVFGAFVLRIRDRFDNLDTAQLDGVGRSHR